MIVEEKDLRVGGIPINRIIHGDVLTVLKKLPANSIDCVITSPPYYSKRDYGEETVVEWPDGTRCQLGLEPTPQMFVDHLVEIFKEVKRVLKPHGNVFVVIDDTYSGSYQGYGAKKPSKTGFQWVGEGYYAASNQRPPTANLSNPRRKSLCLVPEMFAIRMVYDLGYILRQKLVWAKKVLVYKDKKTIGNAMPESVKDRNTHTYEVMYHFTKSYKYYYKQYRVNYSSKTIARMNRTIKLMARTGTPITPNDKYYGAIMRGEIEELGNAGLVTGRYIGKYASVKTNSPCSRVVNSGGTNELRINHYLKKKLEECGLTVEDLSDIVGLPKDTLIHIFRVDVSGAMIPSKDLWDKLKGVLGLCEYEEIVKDKPKLPVLSGEGANSPDVIQLNLEPFKEAHFAVFPTKLVEYLIELGCPETVCAKCGKPDCNSSERVPGIVLDPFFGAGTTGYVASKMGRDFIGIEVNRKFCNIAKKRIKNVKKLTEF